MANSQTDNILERIIDMPILAILLSLYLIAMIVYKMYKDKTIDLYSEKNSRKSAVLILGLVFLHKYFIAETIVSILLVLINFAIGAISAFIITKTTKIDFIGGNIVQKGGWKPIAVFFLIIVVRGAIAKLSSHYFTNIEMEAAFTCIGLGTQMYLQPKFLIMKIENIMKNQTIIIQ